MPDPPPVSLLTRYVLENPWPVTIVAAAMALGLAWTGARSGRRGMQWGALAAALIAVTVASIGAAVTTAGEHARRVVLSLVAAAEAADVVAAGEHFTGDATLAIGSPGNPGLPRAALEQRIEQLDGRWRIADNTITRLRAYSDGPERATVELACRTTPEIGLGPVPTSWWLELRRQPDGRWLIERVTWVSMAGRVPVGY